MKDVKEILKEVKKLIAQESGLTVEEVSLNSHFEDDLNMGDFEIANLMVNVEERFGIELIPDDIKKIKTVQELVHAIEDNL